MFRDLDVAASRLNVMHAQVWLCLLDYFLSYLLFLLSVATELFAVWHPRAFHVLGYPGHEYSLFGVRGTGYECLCCCGQVDLQDQHVQVDARAIVGLRAISREG